MNQYSELLEQILTNALNQQIKVLGVEAQSGGCINTSIKAITNAGDFFVKWNEAQFLDMFEKEALGLNELRRAENLVIPKVLATGELEGKAYMVQEFLEKALETRKYSKALAEGLAELHQIKARSFGIDHDNYIGRLVQQNDRKGTWLEFFVEQRLNVQFKLAIQNGFVEGSFADEFERFCERLPDIMPQSEASLLHGDLWCGNAMATSQGASIFDPAVYYGAREMDLAMTELFGGFDSAFYYVYNANYQLANSYKELVDVYNLYPLMVHVNLFGPNSGYLASVKSIIQRFI
ncbi:fructosamine kinase family protein [Roseivirga pacifica]